jgi:Spy/CpxP family protein refolding chaperone
MTATNDVHGTGGTVSGAAPRRRRSRWLTIALVGAVLIAVAGSATAFFGRHHRWHDGDLDPERVRYGVEWMLHDTDPTDAQVDAITAIAIGAHEDLAGLKARHRAARGAFIAAFTADEVDPQAVEALRTEVLAMADEGVTRLTSALTAAAQQLTPAQRRELAERHRRFHDRHHGGPDAE